MKNLTIDYWKIISDSFKLTWRNKYLWWLGLILSVSQANISWNFSSQTQSPQDLAGFYSTFGYIWERYTPWVLIGAIAFLMLIILLVFLSFVSRGALMFSADVIQKNEKTNFWESLKAGKKYFWKMFGNSLITMLAFVASLALLAAPVGVLFYRHLMWAGLVMAGLAVAIILIIGVALSFVKRLADCYIVITKIKLLDAIENACLLFQKRWGSILIMALVMLLFGLASGLVTFLVLVTHLLVFGALGFLGYWIGGQVIFLVILGLGIASLLVCIFVISSFCQVMTQVSWVRFFKEIAKPKDLIGEAEKFSEEVLKEAVVNQTLA